MHKNEQKMHKKMYQSILTFSPTKRKGKNLIVIMPKLVNYNQISISFQLTFKCASISDCNNAT